MCKYKILGDEFLLPNVVTFLNNQLKKLNTASVEISGIIIAEDTRTVEAWLEELFSRQRQILNLAD